VCILLVIDLRTVYGVCSVLVGKISTVMSLQYADYAHDIDTISDSIYGQSVVGLLVF